MLIFWRQRLVVLATPKTGSTSLHAALESLADVAVIRPPALKHTPAAAFRANLAPWLQADGGAPFETVALVRDPRDWLGSWFRSRRFDAAEHDHAPDPALDSFDAFVTAHLSGTPPAVADVGSQARFLAGGVDRLFRYDRFHDFTAYLERALDCELILPRLNDPPDADVSLTPQTESRLRAARAADYALFASA